MDVDRLECPEVPEGLGGGGSVGTSRWSSVVDIVRSRCGVGTSLYFVVIVLGRTPPGDGSWGCGSPTERAGDRQSGPAAQVNVGSLEEGVVVQINLEVMVRSTERVSSTVMGTLGRNLRTTYYFCSVWGESEA